MDLQLQGKRALITGSTAGIGLATAVSLALEGASVVVNGRTKDRVDAAVQAVVDSVHTSDVRGIAANLGTASGVDALGPHHLHLD